jgi:hypothetical protein
MKYRIYADFHNLDDENRVRLNSVGTSQDLNCLGLQLTDGLTLTLYSDDGDDFGKPDDILVDGVVRYSATENTWVVEADWTSLRHASDEARLAGLNGLAGQSAAKAV